MKAEIKGISYYLPENNLTNEQLELLFPEWTADQIFQKTGIKNRHIAKEGQTSADLAVKAAEKLFSSRSCSPSQIEMVILCTQSPDYFLPTTACIIQDRLGITKTSGALDINLGCSGYIYGLALAKGLIESGIVSNVLLLTAETYSKYIHPQDKNVRTIFGDAGTATYIDAVESDKDLIGPFVLGTDGSGANELIVRTGASRYPTDEKYLLSGGRERDDHFPHSYIFMNGPSIFSFTLKVVPHMMKDLLTKAGLNLDDVDLFIFHQANRFMLENLRRQSKIPEEKFVIDLEDIGNTVNCTIPIAIARSTSRGLISPGNKLMLVGFGVGLSWGSCMVTDRWSRIK